MLIGILLKSIKFISDLDINIFAFTLELSAFGLNNPDRAIFFSSQYNLHRKAIGAENHLNRQLKNIVDRCHHSYKSTRCRYGFHSTAQKHFAVTANKTCRVSRSIFMIRIA